MRGTITRVGRFLSISGDDGKEYIGFWPDLKNPKDKKKYCWLGNACEFVPEDQGGKNLVATSIVPDKILDPQRFEKEARRQENQERHERNLERKAANREKQEKLEDRAALRRWYERDHLRYVVYQRLDGEWVPVTPYEISEDMEEAKLVLAKKKEQEPGKLFQIRKKMVHQVYGKYVFNDPG